MKSQSPRSDFNSGICCQYVSLGNGKGLKLFRNRSCAQSSYDGAVLAYHEDIGPAVYSDIYSYHFSDTTMFGFVVEEVLTFANIMRAYESLGYDSDRLMPRYYGYFKGIADEMMEKCPHIEYLDCDLHWNNFGIDKNGKEVLIDTEHIEVKR